MNNNILNPKLGLLKKISNNFAKKIPYQNFNIHLNRLKGKGNYANLSINNLVQQIFINQEGGMCYELSEMMFYILSHSDFKVERIGVYPLNDKPYNPLLPSTHIILIINLNNDLYLLDIGYGYNSIRYPLKLKKASLGFFDNEEIIFEDTFEKYKIEYNEDHIIIYYWIENKWFSLYRIILPMNYMKQEDVLANNINLMEIPEFIPIRDQFLKIGLLTEKGRIGYSLKLFPNFEAFRIITENGNEQKKEFYDLNNVNKDILDKLNLKIPSEIQLSLTSLINI